ncbi:MAG: transposase, partial [Endomicrobia bacterium]|nr:transposase [Endomicrobiia bacterium]
MPRTARKNFDGKYFHIMVQGIAKENIFSDDNTKGYYLSCMQNAAEKNPVAILGFCVMSNHAHLLLSAENISIAAKYMKLVNVEYARYYNTINQRVGYVFRDRFKSEVIQDKKYLLNCLVYIHNNPVEAKIVDRAQDYNYSSYTNYLTGRGIVDFKEAKELYDISPEN